MLVVKLGGSLAQSEVLPRWLDACVSAGAGRIVIVPGGGPWADEVRILQSQLGFDDRRAHRLALRAMEEYGRVLVGMKPGLVPAADVAAIRGALENATVPVWMPHDMVVADASIPESWEVTSDSLAAWLAALLGASELLLVKSLEQVDARASVAEMAARGWVDPGFPRYASGRFEVRMLGKSDYGMAAALFSA
jgi:aspartokinase-like uncharacterized kinase